MTKSIFAMAKEDTHGLETPPKDDKEYCLGDIYYKGPERVLRLEERMAWAKRSDGEFYEGFMESNFKGALFNLILRVPLEKPFPIAHKLHEGLTEYASRHGQRNLQNGMLEITAEIPSSLLRLFNDFMLGINTDGPLRIFSGLGD